MPLISRETFSKNPLPTDLSPDEEVFFCSLTKEVFRSYDDFFNRQLLLNSMVWSCAVTGKSGLTYEEALVSERKHKKRKPDDDFTLARFKQHQEVIQKSTKSQKTASRKLDVSEGLSSDDQIAIPLDSKLEKAIALLIKQTSRGQLSDVVEDVYGFLQQHYFIGECLLVNFKGRNKLSQVINVEYVGSGTCPNEDDIPENYLYTVQFFDLKHQNMQISIDSNDIFRRKHILAKSRCKLFIRHNCTISEGTSYKFKKEAASRFDVDNLDWGSIFGGTPKPKFEATPLAKKSTQLDEQQAKAKAEKRAAMDAAALAKRQNQLNCWRDDLARFNLSPDPKILTNDHKFAEEALQQLKVQLKKCKEEDKERQKEERRKVLEWKRLRDDLECDDHKPFNESWFKLISLPKNFPENRFSDCLSILEFFNSFSDIMSQGKPSMKHFFDSLADNLPQEIISNEIVLERNGFLRLIHVFLVVMLELVREEELEEDREGVAGKKTVEVAQDKAVDDSAIVDESSQDLQAAEDLKDEKILTDNDKFFDEKYAKEAGKLHESIKRIFGSTLAHLPLNVETLNEVLRLIILTSGRIYEPSQQGAQLSRFRAQNRGGFRCFDDHLFSFYRSNPHILDRIKQHGLLNLSFDERLDLLLALRDQLLTFGVFRDPLMEHNDTLIAARQEYRLLTMCEQRWHKEALQAKLALQAEKEKPIEELKQEDKQQQAENADEKPKEKISVVPTASSTSNHVLNLMRRLYEAGESKREKLKDLLLDQTLDFYDLKSEELIEEARKIQKNFLLAHQSVLRSLMFKTRAKCGMEHLGRDRAFRNYYLVNYCNALLIETENFTQLGQTFQCDSKTPVDKIENFNSIDKNQLAICSADPIDCSVHVKFRERKRRWEILMDLDSLRKLIDALNPRGFRESELMENLKFYQSFFEIGSTNGDGEEKLELKSDASFFCSKAFESHSSIEGIAIFSASLSSRLSMRLLELEENLNGRDISFKQISRETWRNRVENFAKLEHVNPMRSCLFELCSNFNPKFLKGPFRYSKTKSATETWLYFLDDLEHNTDNFSRLFLYLDIFQQSIIWNRLPAQKVQDGRHHKVEDDKEESKVESKVQQIRQPKLKKLKRIIVEASEKEDVKIEKRENNSNDSTTDCSTVDHDKEHPPPTVMSRTGRHIKKPISFEDLMFESKKNVTINKSMITSEEINRISFTAVDKPIIKQNGFTNNCSNHASSSTSSTENHQPANDNNINIHNNNSNKRRKLEFQQSTSSWVEKCRLVLRLSMNHPDSWPFLKPVDRNDVPDYYLIIKNPMDFRTIRQKLDSNDYSTFDQFCQDIRLIFENCRIYNMKDAPVFRCGQRLQKYVDQKIEDFQSKR